MITNPRRWKKVKIVSEIYKEKQVSEPQHIKYHSKEKGQVKCESVQISQENIAQFRALFREKWFQKICNQP